MGRLIELNHIPCMSGDHTEKPCPLDWLNRWGIPAHQQQFCQCQLTGSLQLEEDVKLLHYHVQELYLEEEESWESQSFVLAFWEISLDNATNRTSADGNEMAIMPRN
jgi:hypothetical protein